MLKRSSLILIAVFMFAACGEKEIEKEEIPPTATTLAAVEILENAFTSSIVRHISYENNVAKIELQGSARLNFNAGDKMRRISVIKSFRLFYRLPYFFDNIPSMQRLDLLVLLIDLVDDEVEKFHLDISREQIEKYYNLITSDKRKNELRRKPDIEGYQAFLVSKLVN